MKKEYDFSKGIRGKFFTANDEMELPIYLDKKIRKFYYTKALQLGESPSELINKILLKDIEIAEQLK
jgi:hypothetical protein